MLGGWKTKRTLALRGQGILGYTGNSPAKRTQTGFGYPVGQLIKDLFRPSALW